MGRKSINPYLDFHQTPDRRMIINQHASSGGGGGGGFDPTIYGTVSEYLNADDITGSDSDIITNWPAQIGTDGTPTGSPILRTGSNGISGKNAVQFSGTNWLTLGVGPTVRTLFVVIKGGGTTQCISSWDNNLSKRMGFIYTDPAEFFTGNAEDIILVTMINGVVTLDHNSAVIEVVSGQRGDAYDGSGGNIVVGAANSALWNYSGLISMWLAYSDAPDMATVQAAIAAQYP